MSAEPFRQDSPAPSPISAPAAGSSRAHHGRGPARGERFAVKTGCASSRSGKATTSFAWLAQGASVAASWSRLPSVSR